MKKQIILVLMLLFLIPIVSAYEFTDYFTELKENKADILGGYSIYTLTNPTDNELVIDTDKLSFSFNEKKNAISDYVIYIKAEHEETVSEYVTNISCVDEQLENLTINQICVDNSYYEDVLKQITDWVELTDDIEFILEPYESTDIKLVSKYKSSAYKTPVKIDWFSHLKDNTFFFNLFYETYTSEDWAWWNTTWSYKKQINMTMDSATAPLGYQFPINVTWNSNMNGNFTDLRFVNATENGVLDHWIEFRPWKKYAIIWIETDAVVTAGTNYTFYMYYGTPTNVTTTSDGNKVFDWFDSLDYGVTTNFTQGTGSGMHINETDVIGHQYSIAQNGVVDSDIYPDYNITDNIVVEFWNKLREGGGSDFLLHRFDIKNGNVKVIMMAQMDSDGSGGRAGGSQAIVQWPDNVETMICDNCFYKEQWYKYTYELNFDTNTYNYTLTNRTGEIISQNSTLGFRYDMPYADMPKIYDTAGAPTPIGFWDNIRFRKFAYGTPIIYSASEEINNSEPEIEPTGNVTTNNVSIVLTFNNTVPVDTYTTIKAEITIPIDYTNISWNILSSGSVSSEDITPVMTTYALTDGSLTTAGSGGFVIMSPESLLLGLTSSDEETRLTTMRSKDKSGDDRPDRPEGDKKKPIIPVIPDDPTPTPFPDDPVLVTDIYYFDVKYDSAGEYSFYVLATGVNESVATDTFIVRSNGAMITVGTPFEETIVSTGTTGSLDTTTLQFGAGALMIFLLIGGAIFYVIKGISH